jgi:hypothetical protein
MSLDGRAWIDQLPDKMAGQKMLLRGLLTVCEGAGQP